MEAQYPNRRLEQLIYAHQSEQEKTQEAITEDVAPKSNSFEWATRKTAALKTVEVGKH